MKILFDQGTPVPLRKHLTAHTVETVYEMGWSTIENGELIRVAEEQGYEVLVTTDQNLKYQQNLQNRNIAIVVLLSTSWLRIQRTIQNVVQAVDRSSKGSYVEVEIK